MKRVLSFLTILFVLTASIVFPTFADATDVGYSAERVVKVDLSAVPDIKDLTDTSEQGFSLTGYTSGTAWKITDATGLRLFSKITNTSTSYNFYEKTVYLANDIDLTGVTDFQPIGNDMSVSTGSTVDDFRLVFRGTFDGQGYAVKNLVMTSNAAGIVNVALFGVIRGAVIRNLIIDKTCSFTYAGSSVDARVGSAVAYAFSNGADKHVGTVEGSTDVYITYRVDNVKNEANVKATAGYAGGIIGVAAAATNYIPYVTGCTNTGNIEGKLAAAGIVTLANRRIHVENCLSTGNITGSNAAAGIHVNAAPDTNSTEVIDCQASGTVTGVKIGKITVILGSANLTETNCNGDGVTLVEKEAEVYLGYTTEEIEYTDTVGYSANRVVSVDLTNVFPICTFLDAPLEATEFKISTPADLVAFSELVNTGASMQGMTIYLENDIDMTGVTIRPIGSPNGDYYTGDKNTSFYFAGTFDGQGHVIDNLVITQDAGTGASGEVVMTALFGQIRSATLKNVIIGSGCSFTYTGPSESYAAGLVAMIYRMSVTTESYSVIDNCLSAATVSGTKSAGGIACMVEGNNNNYSHYLRYCTNTGNVTAGVYAGGILGYINNRRIEVDNCRNIGKVTLNAPLATTSSGAAGICARPNSQQQVNFRNCINNGEIVGPGTLGGIVAIENSTSVKIDSCSNYGSLTCTTADENVGPMYGLITTTIYDHMTNNADRTGLTDKTLVIPVIETSFPNYSEIDDAHDKLFAEDDPDDGNTTTEETPTTDTPTTETPTMETPTAETPTVETSADTTGVATSEEKGCNSSLTGSGIVMLLLLSGAGVVLRRKRD